MAIGLAGCAGPVELTAPNPPADVRDECRALITDSPDVVEQEQRREVEPISPYTSAWGDPAITLACGVAKPDGLNRASECLEVNGVGWFSEQREDDFRFTTIGRETYVQVVVPSDYTPANPLVDLAAPIKENIPVVTPCV
jgi:hypothetical protein